MPSASHNKYNMSKDKVTNNMKTTDFSGWFQNVPDHKCPAAMTYDLPFSRHVTSNKHTIFACFLNATIQEIHRSK